MADFGNQLNISTRRLDAHRSWKLSVMKDVFPATELDQMDPDLDDSRGWTLEAGVRESVEARIIYDVNVFELRVNDRSGPVLRTGPDEDLLLVRTNVGASRTRGVKAPVEALLY